MATDKELLAEARQVIKEQSEVLERLATAAMPYGVVIAKDGKKLVVATDKGLLSVEDSGTKIGETVLLEPMSSQIFGTANLPKIGPTVEVQNITDFGAEIATHGEPRIVALGQHKPKKGDRIMLDPSGSVVIAVIERAKPPYVPTVEHVSWDDIGGQDNAKRLLIEAVELPRKHPKTYAHYGKKPTKGILLSGPPGCGKTMLAKAVATSVGASGGFIAVKGPEILDPYVGVAEANVRDLFRKAEDWKATHGTEAVVFIDEAEAILAKRGGHFSYMEKTIVPMFLTEMDGLESSAAIVILATNRADLLDPAVVRDGRIDYKVEVARPDIKEAKEIMKIHLRGKPVHGSRQELIEKAVQHIYMQELPYSGALFAGLVEKASARAITRDIAAGKLTGVCHEDFAHAVQVIKDQEGLAYAA